MTTKQKGVFLNLLTTPKEEIRKAFDSIERSGFYDSSMNQDGNTLKSVLEIFEQRKKDGSLDDYEEMCNVGPVIYGTGGGHRYFVYKDGHIRFSKYHCHCLEVWEKAAGLGFEVK